MAMPLAFAGAALAACTAPTAHTRPWYAANPAERAVEAAVCEQDPGLLVTTPDCINAEAADTASFYSGFKVAPRLKSPGRV